MKYYLSWDDPEKEKSKDYRRIATKEERENHHRVNAYKRKKAQARYAEEW